MSGQSQNDPKMSPRKSRRRMSSSINDEFDSAEEENIPIEANRSKSKSKGKMGSSSAGTHLQAKVRSNRRKDGSYKIVEDELATHDSDSDNTGANVDDNEIRLKRLTIRLKRVAAPLGEIRDANNKWEKAEKVSKTLPKIADFFQDMAIDDEVEKVVIPFKVKSGQDDKDDDDDDDEVILKSPPAVAVAVAVANEESTPPKKRGRGRPPKSATGSAANTPITPKLLSSRAATPAKANSRTATPTARTPRVSSRAANPRVSSRTATTAAKTPGVRKRTIDLDWDKEEEDEDDHKEEDVSEGDSELEVIITPPKKMCGRPRRSVAGSSSIKTPRRKSTSDEEEEESTGQSGSDLDDFVTPPKKRRGRPPKSAAGASSSTKTPRRKSSGVSRTATPIARAKTMTPGVKDRKTPLNALMSPIQEAQSRLHVGAVPDSLPCREDEFAEVLGFTESKLSEGTGGCMYISGVPGTGKTATVMEVLRTLKEHAATGEVTDFDFIEINGMRLTEPNQAYVQIWKKLTGQKVTADHANALLEKRFSSSAKRTTILLVDELDMLWNRKQSVLYNLFEWPTRKEAKLVVLAIANTMDLPERIMMNRVSSRLGLTRLTFSPYTHDQLREIVTTRLAGLKVFDKDAVQLVSRKVASLSGDARRALDICRRATEIAQQQQSGSGSALVGIAHVTAAHEEMFCSPKILAIRSCSRYEQLVLRSIVACFKKSGLEETSFDRVYEVVSEQITMEGAPKINSSQAFELIFGLSACRLVLAEHGRCGPQLRIRLNVSQDDVLFALNPKNAN